MTICSECGEPMGTVGKQLFVKCMNPDCPKNQEVENIFEADDRAHADRLIDPDMGDHD